MGVDFYARAVIGWNVVVDESGYTVDEIYDIFTSYIATIKFEEGNIDFTCDIINDFGVDEPELYLGLIFEDEYQEMSRKGIFLKDLPPRIWWDKHITLLKQHLKKKFDDDEVHTLINQFNYDKIQIIPCLEVL